MTNKTEIERLKAEVARLEKTLELYRRRDRLKYDIAMLQSPEPALTDAIMHAVCSEFDVSENMLKSRRRPAFIALPRQLAMSLIYEFGNEDARCVSLHEVGLIFGRDHGTVIHAIQAVKNRLATDRAFAARVARIRAALDSLKSQTPLFVQELNLFPMKCPNELIHQTLR